MLTLPNLFNIEIFKTFDVQVYPGSPDDGRYKADAYKVNKMNAINVNMEQLYLEVSIIGMCSEIRHK